MLFSKAKFESLSKPSQHKKIAELLKELYYNFDPELFQEVKKLEGYLNTPWTTSQDSQSLADSFHQHFSKTGLGISEHNLLIKQSDYKTPKKNWLDATFYLDHLRSAHNIGNILRTIEAFRLGKVLFSGQMANLSHPAVQKTSMGAFKHIQEELQPLSSLKGPLIVLETHHKAISIDDFTFPETFTLVLGNEEYGVSQELLERADVIIEIPLVGCKNSLNVAACFSIVAHKIRKDLDRLE